MSNGSGEGLDPRTIAEWERRVGSADLRGAAGPAVRYRGVDGINRHPDAVQVWASDPAGFEYRLYRRKLNRLTAFTALYTPSTLRRTATMIARGRLDALLVWVGRAREEGWAGDRRAGFTAEPGRLRMLNSESPFEVVASSVTARAGLLIPRTVLGSEYLEPGRLGDPVAGDDLLERMTARFVEQFAADAAVGLRSVDLDTEFTAVDLIRSVIELRDRPGARAADNVLAVRAAVTELIERHHPDPDFGTAAIAETLHFSRRQLYRYFAGQDASVAGLIAARRLAHARQLLTGDAALTLDQIAAATGFTSAATLRNRFRAAFGISPGEFARQQATGPPSVDVVGRSPRRPSRPVSDPFDEPEGSG